MIEFVLDGDGQQAICFELKPAQDLLDQKRKAALSDIAEKEYDMSKSKLSFCVRKNGTENILFVFLLVFAEEHLKVFVVSI